MFRKEARNASSFIALLYVCLAYKVIVQLCMRAGSDNMIQFFIFLTLPYVELRIHGSFARQPCCMAGTMKMFCIRKNICFHWKKNLLFLPCNMAAVQKGRKDRSSVQLSSLILSIYRTSLFHLIISKFQLLFSTSKTIHYFTL